MAPDSHKVDLCFPVKMFKTTEAKHVLAADHGYLLYSALCQNIQELHNDPVVGVFSINGNPQKNRTLELHTKSQLVLRLPNSHIGRYLSLAGQNLQVGEYSLQLQGGYLRQLVPVPRLYSRLVIIKGFTEPENFLAASQRQLTELEIQAQVGLVYQPQIAAENQGKDTGSRSVFLRRTLKIKDKQVVGFALQVEGLSAEESIRLQEKGLGGRRHFGCGLFMPDQRR